MKLHQVLENSFNIATLVAGSTVLGGAIYSAIKIPVHNAKLKRTLLNKKFFSAVTIAFVGYAAVQYSIEKIKNSGD